MSVSKHTLKIAGQEKELTVLSNKNILDSMFASCVKDTPKGCHSGGCGVCKIHIVSGDFTKIKMNRRHISEDEEKNNIVLACRVFPQSDMEIEILSNPISNDNNKQYKFGN